MVGGVVSVTGFPQPESARASSHVHVITKGELMRVTMRLKNMSFCQNGVDKVGLGSGTRWFRVISSS